MKKIYFHLFMFPLLAFFSCSTEIDVNAPYEDITVVYGLINPADSVHYIKVNKAFSGTSSALDLAANSANFNYSAGVLEVTVEEHNSNGLVKSYLLTRTVDEVIKDPGIFDNSGNVLYKFIEPAINEKSFYKLKIVNKELNKEITAETEIINSSKLGGKITVFTFWNGTQYSTQEISLTTGENIGKVEAVLYFNYTEHYTTASSKDSVLKTVKMSLGEKEVLTKSLKWELKGEAFFDNIVSNVTPTSSMPFFSHREVNDISLEFKIAGTELSTFMKVTAPSTSVNQDKPKYTNVNNGIGIFSSRTIQIEIPNNPNPAHPVNVDQNTIIKLQTLGLGFCHSTTSSFKCTQL
ncbi:MAG: DUF4249 family protein [Vicingus serpentipes]|nr:DUF4249 family protein [Vicingus serpentipes]